MTKASERRGRAASWLLSGIVAGVGLGACSSPNGANGQPVATANPASPPQSPSTSGGAQAPAKPATPAAGSGTSSPPSSAPPSQASGAGGSTSAGAAGASSAVSGIGGAANAGTEASAGSSGAVAGVGGAADAAGTSGALAQAGSSGAAGATSNAGYKDCMSEDLGPCGTFTTQGGTKLPLGKYGVVMERNVGKGFEAPLASGDAAGSQSCANVVASFGEDPEESKPLLDVTGIDFKLYTVYRPAQWVEGEKYPIITWGNGTCAKTEGYGALLRYVASHGFFVVAANSRWVGSGNNAMTKALDFAFAATADASSPYYNHLDTSKVGAMGHSQGGMATVAAARDKRVMSVILFNGGNSPSKPFLAVSGDMDIGNPTVSGMKNALTGNPAGGYLFYHKVVGTGTVPGHLTLMSQPDRVVEPTTAWFKYQLLGDMESQTWFVGTDCKLCNKTPDEFEYGQEGLK